MDPTSNDWPALGLASAQSGEFESKATGTGNSRNTGITTAESKTKAFKFNPEAPVFIPGRKWLNIEKDASSPQEMSLTSRTPSSPAKSYSVVLKKTPTTRSAVTGNASSTPPQKAVKPYDNDNTPKPQVLKYEAGPRLFDHMEDAYNNIKHLEHTGRKKEADSYKRNINSIAFTDKWRPRDAFNHGLDYVKIGQYSEAIRYFDYIIERQGSYLCEKSYPLGYYFQALCQKAMILKRNNVSEGISLLERAARETEAHIKKFPEASVTTSAKTFSLLWENYITAGRQEDANKVFNDLLDISRKTSPKEHLQRLVAESCSFQKPPDPEKTTEECEKLRALVGTDTKYRYCYIMSFFYQANSYWNAGNSSKAFQLIKKAHDYSMDFHRKNPESTVGNIHKCIHRVSITYIHWSLDCGRFQEASESLKQLETTYKNSDSLGISLGYFHAKGNFYFKQNRYDLALEHAVSGLNRFPNEPKVQFFKFRILAAKHFSAGKKLPEEIFSQLAQFARHYKNDYQIIVHYHHVRLTELTFNILENGGFNPKLKEERDSLLEAGKQLCEKFPQFHGAWSFRAHIHSLHENADQLLISEYHEKARALDKNAIEKKSRVNEETRMFKQAKELALQLINEK